MKFLQKLVFLSGLIGLIAATPDDNNRSTTVAPIRVMCGSNNQIWEDGETLGKYDGQNVYTLIVENRVYIRWDGVSDPVARQYAFNNTAVVLHLTERKFPISDDLMKQCINSADPSTNFPKYLGGPGERNGVPGIFCNGNLVLHDRLFSTYIGGDGVKTYNYSMVVNGRLRINFNREGQGRDYNQLGLNVLSSSLNGENGSFPDANLGWTPTASQAAGCFWNGDPLPATLIAENNCDGGPTLNSTTNISKTGLRFNYTGNNIPNIKWAIKSGGSEVRTATTPGLNNAKDVDISFESLAAGNYALEIQGGSCSSTVSSQNFTVNEPAPTPCNGGPTITGIRNIGSSSLTVDFSGNNIPNFNWKIKNGSTEVKSGRSSNNPGNSFVINYDNINNGNYTLELQGADCTSGVSAQGFTISVNCPFGPLLRAINSSSPTALEFNFHGAGVYNIGWKIMKTDGNREVVREGTVPPSNDHPVITYAPLADGKYELQIQGSSCISAPEAKPFGVNVVLPIYISDFEGAAVKKGVQLTWNVVSEKGGEGFEILRFGEDAKKAEAIAKIALTEQRTGKYQFLDETPLSGNNYYQLKQIDLDGTYTTSKIIAVKFDKIYEALVAPNPARDYVNIRFMARSAGISSVEIYSLTGVKLSAFPIKVQEGSNNHRVHIGKLAEGYYILKVPYGSQSANMRFIKAN